MSNKANHYSSDLSLWGLCRYAFLTRRVWWFTATARTKARFARTLFGSFWLGLSNLLSIVVLALVYGTVFRVPDFNAYVVYLGFGLVLWNSLSAAISTAPSLFESQAQLLKNTSLHPVFYTLEEWAFQLQTFGQSFVLVFIVLSLFQPSIWIHIFAAGLLPLVNFILALYWMPLLVCVIGARYRDLYQLVPIVLQLMFLLSPILYSPASLGKFAGLANINVLYLIVARLRDALLAGALHPIQNLVLFAFNLLGLFTALRCLNRQRWALPFLV
jgi:lipopolysaccharide transport system permease protein